MAWKDVILLLDETLTCLEQQRVLDQATQVGNDYHLQKSSVKPTPQKGKPRAPESHLGPKWFPRQILDEVPKVRPMNGLDHFIHLTIEGLKRARIILLNYFQVTDVQ
jgi:hypothetical protein